VRALIAYPLAVIAGFLPKRYWDDIDLPIENTALASALASFFAGAALGIVGYFEFMNDVLSQRLWTAPPMMIQVYISYVLFTPRGVFSLYLVAAGFIRYGQWHVGEPTGDPVLTLIDSAWRTLLTKQQAERARRERLAQEREDEPDRRYGGDWAGLQGVDFVIVSARRKPGWTKGTYVITSDGWYVLGEPVDRAMANGLRTLYPLTAHRTLDVLRKGVTYELPPLRGPVGVDAQHRRPGRMPGQEKVPVKTASPPEES
jgi:hypothetical protein